MRVLLPVLWPIAAGVAILVYTGMCNSKKKALQGSPAPGETAGDRASGSAVSGTDAVTNAGSTASHGQITTLDLIYMAALALETVFVILAAAGGGSVRLFSLTDTLTLGLRVDGLGSLFAVLTSIMWLLTGIHSVAYMKHEEWAERFYGFYLIVVGVLVGLDCAADLVTFYVFYEMMTLTSLPLVLHELTKEAVQAGLKYLFYSVGGAFLALFGIFYLANVCGDLSFTAGGRFTAEMAAGAPLLLTAVFCMIVGFGTKAGMFPLHGWLPIAHPVAPAPASAVLSGVITKAGVLALVRIVYFLVGPDVLRGTWVQAAWMVLALLTVFMGSMLAYCEKVFKKRLAYSTVSQVSYVLFGLSLMNPVGFTGALTHVVFHSVIKTCLFLFAGAVIVVTGWKKVDQLRGLGRVMPLALACYTMASLALIGIPPFSGFVSKWYLATGSLASGTGALGFAGPVVLLISALLTAGYLLPIMIQGYFPGQDFDGKEIAERGLSKKEPSLFMLVPIVILAAAALLLGCFPGPLVTFVETIAAAVMP